jgi:hypothetical protein
MEMTRKTYRNNSVFIRYTADRLCLVAIFALLTFFSICFLSLAVAGSSELMNLISENEDISINVNDLAYFLAIHDFYATPKKDYVEVCVNNTIYKLVPNGRYPGLANATMES